MDERNSNRVAIAKDVIRWVSLEKPANLVVESNSGYFRIGVVEDGDFYTPNECNDLEGEALRFEGNLKKQLSSFLSPGDSLTESKFACQVCALGAVFLAHVMRNNEFEAEKATNIRWPTIYDVLNQHFTNEELGFIEGTFELWSTCDFTTDWRLSQWPSSSEPEEYQQPMSRLRDFFGRKKPIARIVYVMNHLIENDGEFNLFKMLDDVNAEHKRTWWRQALS